MVWVSAVHEDAVHFLLGQTSQEPHVDGVVGIVPEQLASNSSGYSMRAAFMVGYALNRGSLSYMKDSSLRR